MVTFIISHEVKDFDHWKIGSDADEANRSSKGVKFVGLFTAVENSNQVTVIFEAPEQGINHKIYILIGCEVFYSRPIFFLTNGI